jgi:hypothetical protein
MKILITVLGIARPRPGSVRERDYEGVDYQFEDGSKQDAEFFSHALAKHQGIDKVVVLATEQAEKEKWSELKEWLDLDGIHHEILRIKSGKDRAEAWEIFNTVVGYYNQAYPDDSSRPTVYMDMTNGLRSMPILLLSVARYLSRARNIIFGGIYYGAYDAVERTEPVKPVYRLDSFMTVLDLAGAVDVFLRTGDGRQLGDLIEENADAFEIDAASATALAEALYALSDAFDLLRPDEVMENSYALLKQIERVVFKAPKAIGDLLQTVYEDLHQLTLSEPHKDIKKFLVKGLALVNWYYSRYRYIEAIGLAREWFVTYRMFKSGKSQGEIFNRDLRRTFEESSTFVTHQERPLWTKIKHIRNDIAHSGMSDERASSAELITHIGSINSDLQKLKAKLV